MSRRNAQGFTLIELVIVMTLSIVIAVSFYTFFKTNLFTYLNLQKDASSLTDLAAQSQRIANVVRGLTDITSASADDLVIYAYFYPSDAYVSLVHYYLSADGTVLYADVTHMTSNPPTGTAIPGSLRTYTVMPNFRQTAGLHLFEYINANGTTMSLPISDLNTIKRVRVNLGVHTVLPDVNQALTLEVSLRNRKNNL